MTRSSLKDFISIILVAPYDITRRGKVGRKFDISEIKKTWAPASGTWLVTCSDVCPGIEIRGCPLASDATIIGNNRLTGYKNSTDAIIDSNFS